MQRITSLLFLLVSIALLSACGPVYKKEYSYVPPVSNVAKMCTAQCVQSKNACEQMCQMRNENCRMQSRQDAMYEYENYREQQERLNKPIDKRIEYFDQGSYRCNTSCNCAPTYRSCYSACGGEVLERNVCVAFCDKK